MKTILRILALCALATPVHAANIIAASPSSGDVQAALDLVSAGDTVVIPAGSGSWTTQVLKTLPANVTILGAGTSATGGGDQTIITDNYASGSPVLGLSVPATGVFRLSGITFQSGTGAIKDGGSFRIDGPSGASAANVRIDHCHVIASSASNYKMLYIGKGIFGVLDSSIIDLTGPYALYFYNGRDNGENQGNYEWSLPTGFGGDTFFYIEDCIINGTSKQSRLFDANNAAKVVVRFSNLLNACLVEGHGTGHSNDDRGPRAMEIYGNAATSTIAGDEPNNIGVGIQGGGAMVGGNSWNQVYKTVYGFQVIRKSSATYRQTPPPIGSGVSLWGYAGPAPVSTGTVNVTTTAVTKASGTNFSTSWPAGTMIYVAGMTAEAVSGQEPPDGPDASIASVGSTTSLTLGNGGQLAGPLTGATYYTGSVWDGNTTPYGYPAIDQPGRGQGDLLTGSFPTKVNSTTGIMSYPNQALDPVYIWSNVGTFVSGWGGAQLVPVTGLVVSDRDYYAQASGIQTSPTSPFDGTTGTGWGTLTNRPTTCTTGVGYWATDQGSWNQSSSNPYGVQQNGADGVLYVATSTNTWTLYYEPYTYPHPLRNTNQVQAPNFNPSAGNYSSAQSVTITSGTVGATIRYTMDGSTPTPSAGTIYSTPVSITSTATLKAIAYNGVLNNSDVTTGVYSINGSPGDGVVTGTTTVTTTLTLP